MIECLEVLIHRAFATNEELIEYGYKILGLEGDWLFCVIE